MASPAAGRCEPGSPSSICSPAYTPATPSSQCKVHTKLIPKQAMLKYVMMDVNSYVLPARQEGWTMWSHTVKDQARPPINLWADPPGNIYRLLALLKPVRIELASLERHGLYTDKMFDCWMPSRSFYAAAVARGGLHGRDLYLALAAIQFHRFGNSRTDQWSPSKELWSLRCKF